ncbi:hypothetical protein S7711_04686 [Stachybotrys chartarum IBT 7711]|uniref:Uncharacterized protein n=1 Tax=Stachybotrys chartarum (strain CBS 109288 / IBT 7711) TaxID=1280523 RepID=A0A084B645_STACB|nr:hypothetical protein S7711_04686 [Stachybotrys chartarum IBT 7711]
MKFVNPNIFLTAVVAAVAAVATPDKRATGPRPMENLGRGVVAVRQSEYSVLVSWRLLGLDPVDIGFNVYRTTGDGEPELINSDVLTDGTNFVDATIDASASTTYTVHPVIDGEEQDSGGAFMMAADALIEPAVRIPLQASGPIKFIWVGDLDSDGEYDFVVDRHNDEQGLEAYKSDGTLLWTTSLGPLSKERDNISPGPSTIDVGHWDGVTVYDFDSDGYAEVAVRLANGAVMGDGKIFSHENDEEQFIAILDGRTGALRASAMIPTDFIADGPVAARLGVGYLDGVTPHLVSYMKNRKEDGDFNLMEIAWIFDGDTVTMAWKWLREDQDAPDGHNTRSFDVDGDGIDEVQEIGFCLNGDGTIRYLLGPNGIVHGDRFHIAKMTADGDGWQGYGVQQDNPSFLLEYYYDASTGEIIWEHYGDNTTDVGRGMVGDIDPRSPGMEVWSFGGVYNAASNSLTEPDTELAPWPQLGLYWDGDPLLELYNDGKIEKWDPEAPSTSNSVPRILHISNFGAMNSNGPNPGFLGDLFGDWREEVITTNKDFSELIIFTTDIPTDIRLYTLAHNPAYRNSMTFKGYPQSHHVDYYIGDGMGTPPRPNIRYVGV